MKNDPNQSVPANNKPQAKAVNNRMAKGQQDDLKIEVLDNNKVERTIILERKGVGLTLGQWQELVLENGSLDYLQSVVTCFHNI